MTQTPASGPLGPVTTPPMSSPSIATAGVDGCRVAVAPSISVQVPATIAARKVRIFMALLLRAPATPVSFRGGKLPEHGPDHNPDVGRPLCQPAHIPGEPVLPVADEDAQPLALPRQPRLLPSLDAVEHRKFIG